MHDIVLYYKLYLIKTRQAFARGRSDHLHFSRPWMSRQLLLIYGIPFRSAFQPQ